MKTYEIIEHTADIGIKAFGKSLSAAFENAAKAMFDIITNSSMIDSVGQYKIELEAPDFEQLLIDWLSELLFLSTSQNLVFGFFHVTLDKKTFRLSANVCGEKFSTKKHKIGVEIKAVTYHKVKVHIFKPYFAQVIFDI